MPVYFSTPEPDPAACCPDSFYCPAAGETECPRHGEFDVCCAHPDEHVPMDIAAWHLAQEAEERLLLDAVHYRVRTLTATGNQMPVLGAVLDEVLGAVPSSTLGETLGVIEVLSACAAG